MRMVWVLLRGENQTSVIIEEMEKAKIMVTKKVVLLFRPE